MASLRLPDRVRTERRRDPSRSCPAHRAWVRRHHCCVPGCRRLPIECAHVRTRTDGGTALKPSDRWCISLCRFHHAEQHRLGEPRFEQKHRICLTDLAEAFARRSPHYRKLDDPNLRKEL
ncbi:hypothetical protein LVY65_07215 [Sphingomonas sp. G124]|uniref:DUF968 domain-containing protein n=1 Tax=Sphingomonas cremea TaxID=2904799 RepID=A0A9X1TYI0_9SPHN|nr:hypothetical protein [Sphingomonas cremea]MCF2514852.1 hypothetical protein [Sphingomonas cremea]